MKDEYFCRRCGNNYKDCEVFQRFRNLVLCPMRNPGDSELDDKYRDFLNWFFVKSEETDHLKSETKWISVDDRLPATYGYYLCFDVNDEYKGICKSSGFEICRYSPKNKKFLTNLSGWQHEFELTHWMPLPSPPTN